MGPFYVGAHLVVVVFESEATQRVKHIVVQYRHAVVVSGVEQIRAIVAIVVVGAEVESIAHLAVLAVGPVVAHPQADVGAAVRVVIVFEGILVESRRGVGDVVQTAVAGAGVIVRCRAEQERAQVVAVAVELLGEAAAEHTEEVGRAHIVHHIILVCKRRRQIHVAAVPAVAAVAAAVEVEVAPYACIGHTVYLVVDVQAYAAAQVATFAPRAVALVDDILQRVEVARIERVVLPRAAPAPRVVLRSAVAEVGEEVDIQLLVGPGVTHPGTDVGLCGYVGAKADKVVLLDVCRRDDVDDRLGVSGILCRRVGDGLYAVEGVGRQGLQVGLQVLRRQFRRLVVDPNLHRAHAAQGDVALHVDLHAGRVLQGVLGRSGLYSGVVGHVVDHLLAIHGIEGPRGLDGHRLKHR